MRLNRDSNRLVFSADQLRQIPLLLNECNRFFDKEPAFTAEAELLGDASHFLDGIEERFFDENVVSNCDCVVNVSLGIGSYHTNLAFYKERYHWNSIRYKIEWFLGGRYMHDAYARFVTGRHLSRSDLPKCMPEFRQARQVEVEEYIPIFAKAKFCPDDSLLTSTGNDARSLWQGLSEWIRNDVRGTSISVKCNLVASKEGKSITDTAAEVADFFAANGFSDVCSKIDLSNFWVEQPSNSAEHYHSWLADVIGTRTMSNALACYTLGYLGESTSLVNCFISPAGAVVGYFNEVAACGAAPPEITELYPTVPWMGGSLPTNDDFPFPSRSAFGEWSEPIDNDFDAIVTELKNSIKKFKPKREKSAALNSLEYQIRTLSALGFELARKWTIHDLVRIHPRSWYEVHPFVNIFKFMGNNEEGERCSRLWHIDFNVPPTLRTYEYIMSIVQGLTSYSMGFTDVSSENLMEDGNGVRIAFQVEGVPYDWTIGSVERWFDWNVLVLFDEILIGLGFGVRFYESTLDDGSFLIAAMSPEELSVMNSLVPNKFEWRFVTAKE